MHQARTRLAVVSFATVGIFALAGAGDGKTPDDAGTECPEGTLLWQRTTDVFTCAAPCNSDEDCPGFKSGEERCRLIDDSSPTAEDVFVDKEMADEIAADVQEQAEELDAFAETAPLAGPPLPDEAVADEAAAADPEASDDTSSADDTAEELSATIIVQPECDEACDPIEVPRPIVAAPLRLCDALWDTDLSSEGADGFDGR